MALEKSAVEAAVLNHLGSDYQVTEWTTRDFTKKGDNYVTVVTGLEAIITPRKISGGVLCENRLCSKLSSVIKRRCDVNEENDRLNANNTDNKLNHNAHRTITNLIFDLKEISIRDDANIVDIFPLPSAIGASEKRRLLISNDKILTNTNGLEQDENNSNLVVNESSFSVSYVAKVFPNRPDGPFRTVISNLHRREGEFFCNIAPRLDAVLNSAGISPLSIPKCYFACYIKGKELLITEDMRSYGFKMADRRKGLTNQQTRLVLRELAKLHASSYVLRKRNNNENFDATYSFIREMIKFPKHSTVPFFEQVYQGNISGTVKLLEQAGQRYSATVRWLKELSPDIVCKLADQLTCHDDRFKVLCHGDTWINNFLFNASSVCILDLQTCRFSSLATDLSYCIHTSVTTSSRRMNTDHFLAQYHAAYEEVLHACGMKMPFTVNELKSEVLAHQLWGLTAAMLIVPTIVLESSDAPVLNTVSDDQYESSLQGRWEQNLRRMNTSPGFKERFLGVFDDMIASGFLPSE